MNFSRLNRLRHLWLMLTLLGLLALTSVSMAQDDSSADDASDEAAPPILEMLSTVPANVSFTASELIGFSDFNAAAAARGLTDYEIWADFAADLEADALNAKVLLQSLPLSGFPGGQYLITGGPEMPQVMGFDFFDIDTALSYGQPPEQVYVFGGAFDTDQIDAAVTANGYVRDDLDDTPYWCSEEGCDAGMKQDFANRNPANFFGGDLGRHFPFVQLGDHLVASPVQRRVEAAAATYTDDGQSLADDPRFAAAVSAMYGVFTDIGVEQPLLREAYFVPPDAISGIDPFAITRMSPEQLEALKERLETGDENPLPVYQLAALTDFGSVDYQYAQVVLIYASEADAQTATEIIPQRLETMQSLANGRPFQDLFTDREMEMLDAVVYEDEVTGQYAAVFTFQYPAAPELSEDGRAVRAGLGYHLFVNMLMSRDLYWLAPEVLMPE